MPWTFVRDTKWHDKYKKVYEVIPLSTYANADYSRTPGKGRQPKEEITADKLNNVFGAT